MICPGCGTGGMKTRKGIYRYCGFCGRWYIITFIRRRFEK